jgi:probable H4MPT-linked C1 transfer pathway protein
MTLIAGYDVGGAHLKVALAADDRLRAVRQIACPLWRGLDHLDAALAEARVLTADAAVHRVTMTGEMADVFPDRYTGVCRIVERTCARLGPRTLYWRGPAATLVPADVAVSHDGEIASTNFLATVALVAARLPTATGLVVDMGSTTTDIVPFSVGRAIDVGTGDADRLRSGALIYTGLTRTPVGAVTTTGLHGGAWQGLARDPFATMADVYRVLGRLPDGIDLYPTTDGRSTSRADSRARLARCHGADVDPPTATSTEDDPWTVSAAHVAEAQLRSIHDGALQVLSRCPGAGGLVVAAGIGVDVVGELARRLGAGCVAFGALATGTASHDALTLAATRHGPAAALALLPA